MEFMQQDLSSVNEIFEMIQFIELDQWFLDSNTGNVSPGLVSQAISGENQVA